MRCAFRNIPKRDMRNCIMDVCRGIKTIDVVKFETEFLADRIKFKKKKRVHHKKMKKTSS